MKKLSIILPYYNRKELLLNTLASLEFFYHDKPLEVIIVDDTSSEEHRLENDINFNLDIKLIRLENKNGINPCYPYNVGARESSGEILLLSSPETFHTTNIFDITNNFELLNYDTYLLFSVFCLTHINVKNEILSSNSFETKLSIINKHKPNFFINLGINGYLYNNHYGSWYLHSSIRPSGLNFMTAISKDKYYDMSGFDERFRFGTGYDDNEFKDRLLESNTNFIYYDNAIAIHINHEIVNNALPTTNYSVYLESKNNKYQKNDSWGKH